MSFLPQLVPLITRNYLKQGFMEKTGPKVYSPAPWGTFMAPVPAGSRTEFERWKNGEPRGGKWEAMEENQCVNSWGEGRRR